MKPIKLEIAGLQSYEANQIIDFSALSSRGIFGIFGATGSGKSTILDAIILALYGKVYRSKSNSDFINLKSKQAVVVFDFSFMEDGQEKVYSVRREFKRKLKNKMEVDQIAEVYELGAVGKRQVVQGVNKVDKFIVDLIGMTDVEFLKCIALPQGEFASFLKAKPNERVSIIGNIFDLNKYGQELWERVKTKTDALETEKAILEGKLSVVGAVDESTLVADKEALENLGAEIESQKNKLELLAKTEKEEREIARLGEELEKVKKTIVSCEELANSITLKKEALKKAKKIKSNKLLFDKTSTLTVEIMNEADEIYRQTERLKSTKARTEEFQKECEIELASIKGSRDGSIAKLERLKNLIDVEAKVVEQKCELDEKRQDLKLLEVKILELNKKITENNVSRGVISFEIKTVDEELNELKSQLRELQSVLTYQSLSAYVEELKTYKSFVEQKYEEAVNMMTNAIDAQSELADTKKSVLTKLKSLHKDFGIKGTLEEPRMGQALEAVLLEQSKFEKLKNKVEQLIASRIETATAIVAEENKRDRLEQEKIKLDQKYKKLADEISDIKSKVDGLTIDKEQVIAQNGVSMAMAQLKIGDECPICKNEILVKKSSVSIDCIVLENEIKELQEVLARKQEARDNVLYAIAKTVSSLETIEDNILVLDGKYADQKKQLIKTFELHNDATVLDEEEEIKKLESLLQTKLAETEKAVKQEKLLMSRLRELSQDIIKQNCISASMRLEVDSFGELLTSLSASIKNKESELIELFSSEENVSQKVSKLEKVNFELEKTMSKRDELNKKLTKIDEEISGFETELAVANTTIETLKKQIIDLETRLKGNNLQIESETIGGDVRRTIEMEEQEIAFATKREIELKSLLDERLQEVSQLSAELAALISQNKAHKVEHKEFAENLQMLLKDIGVDSVEESRLFMMDDNELAVLDESIKNYEKDYAFAQTRKSELESVLCGKVSSSAIIEQINLQIESITKEINEKSVSQAELKYSIAQRDEKRLVYDGIQKDLAKTEKEYNLSKELYDLLKGKALLEFIAEEFINDISFMASNKLQILMDGRYILKYQNKEFYVIDNFNDAIERPVSTLSGGEMFVVSLALALSISDAIVSKSNKSIDFFFLDEGFGTLDKEYCEYIVDSLIKLESQNLTIGLISHIPELQEKIIHKLGVEKTANGTIVRPMTGI